MYIFFIDFFFSFSLNSSLECFFLKQMTICLNITLFCLHPHWTHWDWNRFYLFSRWGNVPVTNTQVNLATARREPETTAWAILLQCQSAKRLQRCQKTCQGVDPDLITIMFHLWVTGLRSKCHGNKVWHQWNLSCAF